MGKTLRWVIPGSRLLTTDRAAILQSGSPPDVRGAQHVYPICHLSSVICHL